MSEQDDPIVSIEGYRGGFTAGHSRFNEVLKGVDVQIQRSVLTAVVGETGSGKTLLALSVLGLAPPTFKRTGGSIRFEGEDLCAMRPAMLARLRGSRIAMMFQDSRGALNPVFTVGTQLRDVCRARHGLSRRQATGMAAELLEQVQVSEPGRRARQYPHELSGGTVQRVQLAMALACRPALLMLDEPTTGLDVTIQADIMELIVELTRTAGMTTCLITHDLGVVAQTSERVVVMRYGEVVETGSCQQVMTAPRHPYTAELLEAARYAAVRR